VIVEIVSKDTIIPTIGYVPKLRRAQFDCELARPNGGGPMLARFVHLQNGRDTSFAQLYGTRDCLRKRMDNFSRLVSRSHLSPRIPAGCKLNYCR
jgi:hypothetical protein